MGSQTVSVFTYGMELWNVLVTALLLEQTPRPGQLEKESTSCEACSQLQRVWLRHGDEHGSSQSGMELGQ